MWSSSLPRGGPTRTVISSRQLQRPYSSPSLPGAVFQPSIFSPTPASRMADISLVVEQSDACMQVPRLESIDCPRPPEDHTSTPADIPGCATFAQYLAIEAAFERGISPSRREKVLISRTFISQIIQILAAANTEGGSSKLIGSAQLRHWVRARFDVTPAGIVVQQDKPVIIREHLYHALCHAHIDSGHGGRDRTSAIIRQRFSCVPKDLIARFVRACPTCFTRRTHAFGIDGIEASEAAAIPQGPLLAHDPALQPSNAANAHANRTWSPESKFDASRDSPGGSAISGYSPVTGCTPSSPSSDSCSDGHRSPSRYVVYPKVLPSRCDNLNSVDTHRLQRDYAHTSSTHRPRARNDISPDSAWGSPFSHSQGSAFSSVESLRAPAHPPPIFPSGPLSEDTYSLRILPPLRSLQLAPIDGLGGFPLVREPARSGYRLDGYPMELSPFAPQDSHFIRPTNPTPFEASFPPLPHRLLQRMHSADDIRMTNELEIPSCRESLSVGSTPRSVQSWDPVYHDAKVAAVGKRTDSPPQSDSVSSPSADASPARAITSAPLSPSPECSPPAFDSVPGELSPSRRTTPDPSEAANAALGSFDEPMASGWLRGLALHISTKDVKVPVSPGAESILSPASATLSPITPDMATQSQVSVRGQDSAVSGWIPKYETVMEEWLDLDYIDELPGKEEPYQHGSAFTDGSVSYESL